jgi:hypothetical protein
MNNFLLCRIDWTAIFTAALAIIAFWQLRKINRTSSGDFLHKLKNDLFNEKTTLLIQLIDYNSLQFKRPDDDKIPYFEIVLDSITNNKIKNEMIRKIKKLRDGSNIVDAYEIDEFLLGHIEDLGIFTQHKIINLSMVYEEFSWYIEKCWEDNNIKDYIEHQRKEEGWDIYDKAEDIFKKCKSFGEKKKKRF